MPSLCLAAQEEEEEEGWTLLVQLEEDPLNTQEEAVFIRDSITRRRR